MPHALLCACSSSCSQYIWPEGLGRSFPIRRPTAPSSQDLSKDLAKGAREEDELLAVQGLLQRGAMGASSASGLGTAQRSMLQAIEVLAQAQQYAEAAAAAVGHQELWQQQQPCRSEEVEAEQPTNLSHLLLRSHLSSRTSGTRARRGPPVSGLSLGKTGLAGFVPLSLQPSGCSSPDKDEPGPLWRHGSQSLQPSAPSSPDRRPAGQPPPQPTEDLTMAAAAAALKASEQREEMMCLIKQLWSRPTSCAQRGGDGARMAYLSLDADLAEAPAGSPRALLAGSATGEEVADMARQATDRLRAKTILSKHLKPPQSSQGW